MLKAFAISTIIFLITFFIQTFYYKVKNKKEISYIDKLKENANINSQDLDYLKTQEKKKKETNIGFIDRLSKSLEAAEITMSVEVFILIVFFGAIGAYFLTFLLFKYPLIGLAPIPFVTIILPSMIIDSKNAKVKDKFEKELIMVLRRMAAVTKYGSIQQALEEIVKMQNLSLKTQMIFRKIYHKYKYGDSIDSAFRSVAEELDSDIFNLIVISIDLNKELGSDMSNTLNSIAKNIQGDMLNEKEAKSLLGQTKMIFLFLSIMPFLIIGYIQYSNPDLFADYLVDVLHQIIFLCIFIWMSIGVLIINKLIKK